MKFLPTSKHQSRVGEQGPSRIHRMRQTRRKLLQPPSSKLFWSQKNVPFFQGPNSRSTACVMLPSLTETLTLAVAGADFSLVAAHILYIARGSEMILGAPVVTVQKSSSPSKASGT